MRLKPKPTKKQSRQHMLLQIIKEHKIGTQDDLKKALSKFGMEVTQSSLSRDITDLGLVKQHGFYVIPPRHKQDSTPLVTSVESAGPNLIVVKTLAGMAAAVGITVDEHNIPNIIGTVSGDDTVFVAITPAGHQDKIVKAIHHLFKG